MRTGQEWVFLEVGLGIVFVVSMFCLCRYFDQRKARRRTKRARAADEDCYQRQLAEQRERALSIRKESLLHQQQHKQQHQQQQDENAEAKQPLTPSNPSSGAKADEEAGKK